MTEMQGTEASPTSAETIVISVPKLEMERPGVQKIEAHEAWPVLSRLSIPVSAEIHIARFKVRDLLSLETGTLIQSLWPEAEDVQVKAGGIQLGWSEFEVEEQRLMVRLTRLT